MNRGSFYQDRIEQLRSDLTKRQKIFNLLSNLRAIVFLAGAASAAWMFNHAYWLNGIWLITVFLVCFLIAVIKHQHIRKQIMKIQCLIEINQRYLARQDGTWHNFTDNGSEYSDCVHPYTNDLDIFGEKSLYQWLNVACTFYGKETLRSLLSNPDKNLATIKERQNAVKELAGMTDFSQELQSEGMMARIARNPEKLLDYFEDNSKLVSNRVLIVALYVFPVVTMITILGYLLELPLSGYIPLGLIAVQILIIASSFHKIASALNTVHKYKENLLSYNKLIQLIENTEFKDPALIKLKSDLTSGQETSVKLKKLSMITDFIDIRYSMFYAIVNFILLWDFHCVFALERWKEANGTLVRGWLKTIGQFEALLSLAVIPQLDGQWFFPDLIAEGVTFVTKDMGHPLIHPDNRVSNSLTINQNVCVITGSNMSGKTTLLRTVGINLVLAYAGAPVCAGKLECSVMEIFTSMRISDDLSSGISTFYAELLRIKTIIDFSHQERPMLFLIDEIFRGTNSRDRILGAKNVLKILCQKWIIGLVSTHDFELCNLEQEYGCEVSNYHFTESYQNNQIMFDYKLCLGCCTTTNAQYLMKMVGINII